MWKKSLRFLILTLAAVSIPALAAGPVLAWTWSTPGSTWRWTLPSPPQPAPAPVPAPNPTPNPTPNPPPAPVTGLTAQEQQMLDLLNQARIDNGVKPVVIHEGLTRLARLKAQDMVDHNYFGHHSPTLGWPPEMVLKAGITYRYGVGENVVEALTINRAHMQLLASPTHRKNMLDPGFTDVGIGVVPDKYGAIMAAQEFIGR